VGAISARGLYGALESMGAVAPHRAEAAVVRRRQEQYLIERVEVILDNGVTVAIPPIYNDVVTARLSSARTWSATQLRTARSRLEKALATLDSQYPATAAGLTTVVGWGLPYFRQHVPSQWEARGPMDVQGGDFAVLDAIRFPSDPADVVLEDNHVAFKLRSDSQSILQSAERALFEDPTSKLYVGDLLDLTSKRIGFLGRGFGRSSVAKQLALQHGVPGAESIPDDSQLLMGFTSTQTAALGPDNIPSFETLPGVTNQFPSGYFAAGCAMHLSHLFLDLERWYGDLGYGDRVGRMFSPRTTAPDGTVTISNGPADVSSQSDVQADADAGTLGHNATLQQATRLKADVVDNYGRLRTKGTAVPLREDFSTLDNPFAWSSTPQAGLPGVTAAAGLHFAVFTPASRLFHTARLAMDGVLPGGPDLSGAVPQARNGINDLMRASHRQNFVVAPRSRGSFPRVVVP
jgi:hypothetical protein